jgi:CheY-like chemotaxis protein
MDGLELAHLIRRDAQVADIELVILSSVDQEVSAQMLRELGVRCWLTKPVSQKQLNECLLRGSAAEIPVCASLAETAAAPAQSGDALHLLVVEDNPVNQVVAREMLATLGHTCHVAANGREALEAIAQHRYDVVLMDCQMPEMDGFEATKLLRARESAACIPRLSVIALTAHATESDREQCVAAGMDSYLAKPYSQQQLDTTIRQRMERRSATGPVAAVMTEATEGLEASALDALRALDKKGTLGVVRQVLGIYLKSTPALIAEIEAGVAANDWKRVGRGAHSLKSSSRNIGAVRLSHICGDLERAAGGGLAVEATRLAVAALSAHGCAERLVQEQLERDTA